MTSQTNNISLLPEPLPSGTSGLPGQVISVSCNVVMALTLLEGYINSTYSLQAADTKLEAMISNAEAALVQQFQEDMNSPKPPDDQTSTYSNWLYQLSQLSPSDKNYATDVSKFAQLYSACNAENQAETKVMDGNNSTAQNTMNQNAQGQQGIIQTMSSINGVGGNLSRLVQG